MLISITYVTLLKHCCKRKGGGGGTTVKDEGLERGKLCLSATEPPARKVAVVCGGLQRNF